MSDLQFFSDFADRYCLQRIPGKEDVEEVEQHDICRVRVMILVIAIAAKIRGVVFVVFVVFTSE
jgi:hypothetical protein